MQNQRSTQWQLVPDCGLNERVRPISVETSPGQFKPVNRMLGSFQRVLGLTTRMPIGWIRPDVQQVPKKPPTPDDREDEDRCEQVYKLFDEAFRNTYVAQDRHLGNDEFLDACWTAFERGRDPDRGIKDHFVRGISLEQNPTAMTSPSSLVLKPYQLQDVGSAVQIEDVQKSCLLGHSMGLGKTIQTIALAERRKELIRSTQSSQSRQNGIKTILVVVPASLIKQWISDLTKNVPGKSIYDYSEQTRYHYSPSRLAEYDYIVCSYDRLNNEYRAAAEMARHQELRRQGEQVEEIRPSDAKLLIGAKSKFNDLRTSLPRAPLHHVFLERVIVDESHRGRGNGSIAHSLYALQREYTTLLTATPQHNSYFDWYFQFKMTRLSPFCFDEEWFKQYFVNETTKSEWGALETGRVRVLAILLRGIMLRRSSESLFHGKLPFSAIEFEDHEPVRVKPETLTGTKYPHHVALGGKSEQCCQLDTKHLWIIWRRLKGIDNEQVFERSYAIIEKIETEDDLIMLAKIMRARQGAAHPLILLNMPVLDDPAYEHLSESTRKTLNDQAWRELMWEGENYRSSTIDAVLDLIATIIQKGPKGGILIYSQFHRVLDLFEIGIHKRFGIGMLRRTGRSNKTEKQRVLDDFRQWQVDLRDPNATPDMNHLILGMTPISSGEGINLPEAVYVFTTTPALNPQTDAQARGRPFRIGQVEVVHLWRFFMEGSYEDRGEFMGVRKMSNAATVLAWMEKDELALDQVRTWDKKRFAQEFGKIYVERASGKAKKSKLALAAQMQGKEGDLVRDMMLDGLHYDSEDE
ncbi:hypothetical protein KCU92_g10143, partial [Aureobasidium melanogenum]